MLPVLFVCVEVMLHLHCASLQPLLHQQVGSSREGSVSARAKMFVVKTDSP